MLARQALRPQPMNSNGNAAQYHAIRDAERQFALKDASPIPTVIQQPKQPNREQPCAPLVKLVLESSTSTWRLVRPDGLYTEVGNPGEVWK